MVWFIKAMPGYPPDRNDRKNALFSVKLAAKQWLVQDKMANTTHFSVMAFRHSGPIQSGPSIGMSVKRRSSQGVRLGIKGHADY